MYVDIFPSETGSERIIGFKCLTDSRDSQEFLTGATPLANLLSLDSSLESQVNIQLKILTKASNIHFLTEKFDCV